MFTLTKLEAALQTFQSNHKQLKSFYLDKIPSIAQSETGQYPMLFGSTQKGSTAPNQRTLTVKFWIMDKVREDCSNQNKVWSDTELIVLDLLSYFKQTRFSEHVDIELNNDYTQFEQSFNDNCSGWEIEVKFKTIFEWDLCSVAT